jgi:DNA-binding NtrC family response regulator
MANRTRRILVVDDDEGVRRCIAEFFALQGYEVWTAKDGLDALFRLKESPADVLISDLNMPNLSGFELLPMVRRMFPQTLLIAMSGAYGGNEIPDGVTADAFFAKGQSPEHLLSATEQLIHSREAQGSN